MLLTEGELEDVPLLVCVGLFVFVRVSVIDGVPVFELVEEGVKLGVGELVGVKVAVAV